MVPRPWAQVKVFSLHIAFHPLILGAQGKKAKRRHLSKEMFRFPVRASISTLAITELIIRKTDFRGN